MFYKKVDLRSRKRMVEFLEGHFRYSTSNNWNWSSSYANNVKIYNLDLTEEQKDKLFSMLDCDGVYDEINELIDDFDRKHHYKWQAHFNGRSCGYLVLYTGESRPSQYKSYCTFCGQKNFTSVKETGKKCGKCGKEGRIDYVCPPTEIVTYNKPVDQDEDFEAWSMRDLRDRVKLVQEFDQLCDQIADEAGWMADHCEVEEETIYVPTAVKKVVGMD